MKFILKKSAAMPALDQAKETCGSHGNTRFIQFKYEKGNLSLTSVNAFAQQIINVPVDDLEAEEQEDFVIDGRAFIDFVHQMPNDEISVELDGVALKIGTNSGRKTRYTLNTEDKRVFAPITFSQPKNKINLNPTIVSTALKSTYHAAHKEANYRPYTSVRTTLEDGMITCEATDYTRIAAYSAEAPEGKSGKFEVLVPRENAQVLSSILSRNSPKEMTMSISDRHIVLEWPGTLFVSTTEIETTKNFNPLIGYFDEPSYKARVSRDGFLSALKLCSFLDPSKAVSVTILADGGGIQLRTQHTDKGNGTDVVPVVLPEDEKSSNAEVEAHVPLRALVRAVESCEEPYISLYSQLVKDAVGLVVEDGNEHLKNLLLPVVEYSEVEDEENEEAE